MVDDGSKDGTASVAERAAEKFGNDRLRLLKLGLNQGKGAAVRRVTTSFR